MQLGQIIDGLDGLTNPELLKVYALLKAKIESPDFYDVHYPCIETRTTNDTKHLINVNRYISLVKEKGGMVTLLGQPTRTAGKISSCITIKLPKGVELLSTEPQLS